MKRVLLTGASGFIGRFCLAELKQRHFIVDAIARTRPSDITEGVSWHEFDLLSGNIKQLIADLKPTHILHLAWYTSHGKFWDSEENRIWLERSKELADAFQAAGGLRFVFAGSCAEYSWPGFFEEKKSAEVPATLYGKSKKAFNDFLEFKSEHTELSSANGRIFFLYGPFEDRARLVTSIASSLLNGETPQCSDGEQIRDFMFVEDVANAMVALLDSNVRGPVNIATGSSIKVAEMIQGISALTDPTVAIQFGAIPRRQQDPSRLEASVKRLNDEVGYYFQTTLLDGLKKTIEWLKLEHERGFRHE